jgi:hypothetical protein
MFAAQEQGARTGAADYYIGSRIAAELHGEDRWHCLRR